MTERSTATLYGYGRTPWTNLTSALGATTTAWADYDGFHIGHCPVVAPPYSHLWAWTGAWLLRARIDGESAIVAVLDTGGQPPTDLVPRTAERVQYLEHAAHTWPANEKRVGRLAPTVTDHAVTLFEVTGEQSVTFIRVNEQ